MNTTLGRLWLLRRVSRQERLFLITAINTICILFSLFQFRVAIFECKNAYWCIHVDAINNHNFSIMHLINNSRFVIRLWLWLSSLSSLSCVYFHVDREDKYVPQEKIIQLNNNIKVNYDNILICGWIWVIPFTTTKQLIHLSHHRPLYHSFHKLKGWNWKC